jgi:Glycosyl transferase family 2
LKLVMTLVARDEADVLDAHIAFHLNAGVDFVIATDHASTDGTSDILESYVRDGYLRRLSVRGDAGDADWRANMARLAIDEYGADWVIDSEADEFWMPRAEGLKDVLVAIPPRYGAVQALVRIFTPRPDGGRLFAERMTARFVHPEVPHDPSVGRLDWALRPLHRASAGMLLGVDRETALDGRVPLRAWYPIEVLCFPLRSPEQAERRANMRAGPPTPRSGVENELFHARAGGRHAECWSELVLGDEALAQGLADGSLVLDERLRDALRSLEHAASSTRVSGRRFALPVERSRYLSLHAPSVVDDVAYAGECAAVREVDFEPLQGRIAELEQRIASLEARLWPRVRRRLARALRR